MLEAGGRSSADARLRPSVAGASTAVWLPLPAWPVGAAGNTRGIMMQPWHASHAWPALACRQHIWGGQERDHPPGQGAGLQGPVPGVYHAQGECSGGAGLHGPVSVGLQESQRGGIGCAPCSRWEGAQGQAAGQRVAAHVDARAGRSRQRCAAGLCWQAAGSMCHAQQAASRPASLLSQWAAGGGLAPCRGWSGWL